jgi:hypothetical protein
VIQEAGADEFAGVRVIDAEVLVVTSRNEAMLHPPVTLDVEGTCENAIPDLVQPGSALFTALARTTPHVPHLPLSLSPAFLDANGF